MANLLSTAIYETDEGELLILWGGRRIVTTCLIPPLILFPPSALLGDVIERIMVRRYRWDSGALILTRIFDNYTKREDYLAVAFGRNPAILKDFYGRLILAYRIPIISDQDPMGALSINYVTPRNVGTTAGMNFWNIFNYYDFSQFRTDMNFDWQEQTDMNIGAMNVLFGDDYEDIGTLLEKLTEENKATTEVGGGYLLFTDITQHNLTGDIYIRGMGGNLIDIKDIRRWRWNEDEGLGRSYTSCIIDKFGRQVRLAGNQLLSSRTDKWDKNNIFSIFQTQGNYGQSGCLREDVFGHYIVAGYNNKNSSIPFVVENENGIQTEEFGKEKVKVDGKEITIDEKYEEIWAEYNEKKAVIEGADIPSEQHFSYDTPPTPEQEEEARRLLAYSYYQLPTINEQRVGLYISRTGQIFLSWMSGNLTFIEKEQGKFIAVGLRIAVSNDNGRTFEPLTPERVNRFS